MAFVWWRVSDNAADPDLWGHVLYGQRMLHLRGLEATDTLSWTAAGLPWINHEVLAEVALGLAHRLAGGTGLWLLMVGLAALSIGWAWQTGAGRDRTQRIVALGLLGLVGYHLALGYAARPQLFTLLGFVALVTVLRKFLAGSLAWGLVLPLLLVVWVNTHGGFLAGWVFTVLALGAEMFHASAPGLQRRLHSEPSPWPRLVLLNVAIASTLALIVNPRGWQLVFWTIGSLQLPRPALVEWQPMPFAVPSLPFFCTVALGVAGWIWSRQPRRLWEMLGWGLLALISLQHQRHVPLFGLASLLFLPVHLLDLLHRFSDLKVRLLALLAHPAVRGALILVFLLTGGWCLRASVSAPRLYPFRMEIPRDLYPVAAIDYLRTHRLTGNTVTFFDWGQQVLWELPDNPVSYDGRLDTVYSREIIDAHARLYAGREPGAALDLDNARVALLPSGSAGIALLESRLWAVAYVDPLATVLIRRPYGTYNPLEPQRGGDDAVVGSIPFPDESPVLASHFIR